MIIAIDFDQTYTADRDGWDQILEILRSRDHIIYCVTCRPEWDRGSEENGIPRIRPLVHDVFFTDNQAKLEYMRDKGYYIDLWIDDSPATITGGREINITKARLNYIIQGLSDVKDYLQKGMVKKALNQASHLLGVAQKQEKPKNSKSL